MLFAYVFIQRWNIHPDINIYIYIYIDGSGQVLVLPPYYTEIINSCRMRCGVTMVINGGRGLSDVLLTFLQMFLMIHQYTNHHSQPCHTRICKSPHFLGDLFFLHGSCKKAFARLTSFEVYLYPIFLTCFLKTSTESLYVWDNYMGLPSSSYDQRYLGSVGCYWHDWCYSLDWTCVCS